MILLYVAVVVTSGLRPVCQQVFLSTGFSNKKLSGIRSSRPQVAVPRLTPQVSVPRFHSFCEPAFPAITPRRQRFPQGREKSHSKVTPIHMPTIRGNQGPPLKCHKEKIINTDNAAIRTYLPVPLTLGG
jgi:hypothetical protein